MKTHSSTLAEQFDNSIQQKNAASLGMWVFLATEVLFFGVLFLAYFIYRRSYPLEFEEAAQQMNIAIGTINTAILLSSSFFMALAVSYAELGKTKQTNIYLIITFILGTVFLLFKAYEYYDDIKKNIVPTAGDSDPHVTSMFYLIYYTITCVHALHMIIGLSLILIMFFKNCRQEFSRHYYTPIEITGLYWHFVDIVWVFIYPSLYLVGRLS